MRNQLFHISKEHQITTAVGMRVLTPQLFHISKEHQITTPCGPSLPRSDCFTFQKSIKSQQHYVKQSMVHDCFTFQKSIKSQPEPACISPARTVSHFKRASNHNISISSSVFFTLFHISKEHRRAVKEQRYYIILLGSYGSENSRGCGRSRECARCIFALVYWHESSGKARAPFRVDSPLILPLST